MYQIFFYAPLDSVSKIKEAMFMAGAGRYKNYDQCAFEVRGIGQFRPLLGSNPAIGYVNQIEKVEEVKVEMIVEKNIIKEVVEVLKKSHPYEEVAYGLIEIQTL
jgi:hypothetical protein